MLASFTPRLPVPHHARKAGPFKWCLAVLSFSLFNASAETKPPPEAQKHWSFQPPRAVAPPAVKNTQWPKTDIDRFILARLEAAGLTPAPPADPRTLIRRMTFDVTGLPPTNEEVEQFVAAAARNQNAAVTQLTDRLLSSPRYGERWGRHWLDVARYSDTKGYVYAREERRFLHAPGYRDWVIRSFNSSYVVHEDASVDVVEDIQVDFLGLEKHGIFREIPVEYQIEGDPRHHRLITLSNITVDDGNGKNHKFERSRVGSNLQLKIGDPNKTIDGAQRYRITAPGRHHYLVVGIPTASIALRHTSFADVIATDLSAARSAPVMRGILAALADTDEQPSLAASAHLADVVIAACPSRGSRMRHLAWSYFRFLTGFHLDDLTSGFRYYNADACRLLAMDEATLLDYQDIGVLLLLRHAEFRIAEIPVAMNPRKHGASRVFRSWWTVARYMAETSLLCLARWSQDSPRKLASARARSR